MTTFDAPSDRGLDRSRVTAAPAGWYPVPDHHGDVVERRWDGEVWTDETRPAPSQVSLARHHRHLFGFLRTPGWILALVVLAATGASMALVARDPEATRPSGIVWLLPVTGFVAAATVMVAVYLYLTRRLRFDHLEGRGAIVGWGVVSGAVAIGVALLVEVGVPRALGSDGGGAWVWIAGPAEETGKLLVPVVLWCTGRFRLPRRGFLLVVCSAATFGAIEASRYGLSPDDFTWARGWGEVLHVLLTGFVAAVAWQAAWRRHSWFTRAAVVATAVAMLLHSANDAAVFASDDGGPAVLGYATLVTLAVLYVLLKRSARQMVPPGNVEAVSARWRPVAAGPAPGSVPAGAA